MNLSRRLALSVLIAAILLFLALLFWPFVVRNILQPTALVIWLLLRILVLSIHQQYFWYALIPAALFVLFRLLPQEQADIQSDAHRETNATMIEIGYWRGQFVYNDQSVHDQKTLKRELTHLLTSLYASQQGTSSTFQIEQALQKGEIPLPEEIYRFLLSPPPIIKGPLQKFLYSVRTLPPKWIRRWTGQERAEHDRMIQEVLRFMESSLEIQHDDTNLFQAKH